MLTLTIGRLTKGASQGAWRRNAGDWGHPNPSARLTLPPGHRTGLMGATSHSGWENGQGPLSHHRLLNAPLRQNPWAMPPLHSDLNSSCPSARHTALSWGLRASWGLSLTLGQPRGSLPKEPGATTLGIGDTRRSMTDSAFLQPTTLAQQDAAAHSVRENRQCPASPRRPSNAPHAKALGPMLPLPSGLTSVRPAATSTAVG